MSEYSSSVTLSTRNPSWLYSAPIQHRRFLLELEIVWFLFMVFMQFTQFTRFTRSLAGKLPKLFDALD
jgi:hypothetical protein